MKTIILFLYLFFSCVLMSCTEGLPKDYWSNNEDTAPVEEESILGSFESKYKRYYKGQRFENEVNKIWRDTVWKNDRCHKQLVLWSNEKKYTDLSYEVSDLLSGDSRISSAAVRLRFPSYVEGDEKSFVCGEYVNRNTVLIADALSEEKPVTLSVYDPMKIWITIDTPKNIPAGIYVGNISIKSKGEIKNSFKIELCVVDHVLPDVKDWNFHLDLWQFPFQLASLCNESGNKVEIFSDKYFEMVKPFYLLLADAGQKCITTYIKDGAFRDGQSMVKWIKKNDGGWTFDYTNFDKFVYKMIEWGIDSQINCFSLVGWNKNIKYYDESGSLCDLEVEIGEDSYKNIWNSFLNSFYTHLTEKGWFERTVLYMDEINQEQMSKVVAMIKEHNESWKIGLSGSDIDSSIEAKLYDYSTIIGYNRSSSNAISTFYTSCSQQYPNSYVTKENNPAEMVWMAWHAKAKNLSGYLRWAYDYWTKPDPLDIQDGGNASGDFSIIYRTDNTLASKPVSSIRFELLREGIQDFEKIRILNDTGLDQVVSNFSDILTAKDAEKIVSLSQKILKEVSIN